MVINANFAEFRSHVLKTRVLDKSLFAEDVTWKVPEHEDVTVTALCDHKDEIVNDGHNEVLIETLRVVVSKDSLECAPHRGHKLRRADEDRDYLFVYNGRHDADAYRVVFERRRVLTNRLT